MRKPLSCEDAIGSTKKSLPLRNNRRQFEKSGSQTLQNREIVGYSNFLPDERWEYRARTGASRGEAIELRRKAHSAA